MKRIVVIIGAAILLLLPLSLVAYQNWDKFIDAMVKQKFLSRKTVSPQYSAETKVPDMTVAVADTAFLEYIAATMKLYDDNAIADPEMYFKNKTSTKRYSVSHLKFELVPVLARYVVGLGGSTDFAARGIYTVEGDTLVIRVSIDENQLEKSNLPGRFAIEDMFLDTALQTLIYATGKPGAPISPMELAKIQKAIKDNIPTGIFPRPVKIEKTQQP